MLIASVCGHAGRILVVGKNVAYADFQCARLSPSGVLINTDAAQRNGQATVAGGISTAWWWWGSFEHPAAHADIHQVLWRIYQQSIIMVVRLEAIPAAFGADILDFLLITEHVANRSKTQHSQNKAD